MPPREASLSCRWSINNNQQVLEACEARATRWFRYGGGCGCRWWRCWCWARPRCAPRQPASRCPLTTSPADVRVRCGERLGRQSHGRSAVDSGLHADPCQTCIRAHIGAHVPTANPKWFVRCTLPQSRSQPTPYTTTVYCCIGCTRHRVRRTPLASKPHRGDSTG
jgi:hypothetical protein